MKATIEIEQFDNGITLKWRDADGEIDDESIVAYDREKESVIGKTLWKDIAAVMDKELCQKVRMKIEYEPIK